jgi:hypothetical protein
MIEITNSSATAFRDCPRRYLHRYVQLLRPSGRPTSTALYLGTLVHLALEYFWRGTPELAEPALAEIEAQAVARGDLQSIDAAVMAREMIRGYCLRYRPEIGDVERAFSVPIHLPDSKRAIKGWRQAGKFDAVSGAADESAGLCLIEHKTAAAVDGGYLEKLWMDAQIVGYCHAASIVYGAPVRRVMYDVIIKPGFRRGADEPLELWRDRLYVAYSVGRVAGTGIRRRRDEGDDAYLTRIRTDGESRDHYVRESLLIDDATIGRWLDDTRDTIDGIRRCTRTGRWPRNTARCHDWNRDCDYLPICRAGDIDTCGVPYEVAETMHEELTR